MPEVVITGLGPVAPNGIGKDNFWEAIKSGKSGIRRINRFVEAGYAPQIVGEIPRDWFLRGDFHPEPNGAWCTYLISTAAHMTLQDAGITREEFYASRSGIRIGVSTIDMELGEREYESFRQSGTINPSILSASIPHSAASMIARELQCSGKVLTFSTACSSGLVGIISGVESILNGEAEMVLAGGGDAPLTPFLVSCFCAAGLHPADSERFPEPSTASRPFDARRGGGILSEGAGMVLLEEARRASRRRARIYGKITGWGMSNATSPISLTPALTSSMTQALQQAQLSPDEVDYVCAHAPGDRLIDKAEVMAIKEVFGGHAYNVPVSSIKSMIGNPLAAAGVLQVIVAAQAVQSHYIPPTINYQYPDPHCDLDCVPNKGRVARVRTTLVNSSGIGGCIASLVIVGGKMEESWTTF